MDIVTHGLMGALVAQVVCKPGQRRAAIGIGVVAGLLPDVDTLIRSAEDPLLALSMHRHFTHSLLFAPVGAALAALLCRSEERRVGREGMSGGAEALFRVGRWNE